jgi:hypothetical protein
MMAGPARQRPAINETGRSGSSLASRSALCVIREALVCLCDEVHLTPGGRISHSVSYSVGLVGALAPIVGVVPRFHGFLPRFPQFAATPK